MVKQKLTILKQGKIIDETVHQYALKASEILAAEGLDITSDKAQVFITHLAMATMRMQKGEQLEALIPEIQADLEAQPVFERAKELWSKIVIHAPIPCIQAEEGYIYIHMCSLLNG